MLAVFLACSDIVPFSYWGRFEESNQIEDIFVIFRNFLILGENFLAFHLIPKSQDHQFPAVEQ
jgi:hypothetical protein